MLKKVIVGVVVVVSFIAIVGLLTSGRDNKQASQKNPQSSSPVNETKTENTVEISNFSFKPETLTIKKGTTVTWLNNDATKHNVIFDDESAGKVEDSRLISKGEKLQYTFDKVGKFTYHCQPHPYMTASIEVTE